MNVVTVFYYLTTSDALASIIDGVSKAVPDHKMFGLSVLKEYKIALIEEATCALRAERGFVYVLPNVIYVAKKGFAPYGLFRVGRPGQRAPFSISRNKITCERYFPLPRSLTTSIATAVTTGDAARTEPSLSSAVGGDGRAEPDNGPRTDRAL